MKSIIATAIFFTLFCSTNANGDTIAWSDSLFNKMTLDEKIGQLFMIAAYSNQSETHENNIEKQIQKYHVGGIIFFQGSPEKQVALTNRYQQAAKYPLLIGLDAEHGVGWRLSKAMVFPKMAIAGAVRNDSLVYALGAAIARHCHRLGVHVNFAPVIDINSNSKNPVIGTRSFGESPEIVSQKAIQYVKGSMAENVLPVVKHFPGHGDTDTDSHYTLPFIAHSRARLDSVELYPYRRLIEAGAPSVMVSHLSVASLDSSEIPSTLSSLIVHGLLKKELRFKGLCFTDAMNMKGVTDNTAPGEAEVKALLAGNDVLLFPANLEKAVNAIKNAISDKRISEEMIDEKCRKILVAKHQYASRNLSPAPSPRLLAEINTSADQCLKQRLYKEAITLIKNDNGLLPLQRLDTLRIASLNIGAKENNSFQAHLSHYTEVKHFTTSGTLSKEEIKELTEKLEAYNCIIIYNNLASNSPGKQFGYSAPLTALIGALDSKRVIVCHPAIPYGLKNYVRLSVDAIVVSNENHQIPQDYAAQAIFGGIAIKGCLPVSINADYPAGWGIETPKTRLGYDTPDMCGIRQERLAPIDSLCQAAIKMKATPGCQVLITKDGEVIYNKAFGFHTYEQEQENSTQDIYDIASVTKIAATLPTIMQLCDQGQLHIERPIADYCSCLKNSNKQQITVKEILCHHAGLRSSLSLFVDAVDKKSIPGPLFTTRKTINNTVRLTPTLYFNPKFRYRDSTVSRTPAEGYKMISKGLYMYPGYQDTIEKTIINSPLLPKKGYTYSDVGFILLKMTAEEVSGKTISLYCKEHFYRKLGMNSTDFNAADRLPRSRIVPSCYDKLYRNALLKGYVHDPTAAILGGIAGHAGLFSTADDVAKMMQMYLNKGIYGGERYLSPEIVEAFTNPTITFPNNRRGLGFDKPEIDTTKTSPVCRTTPRKSFGHTGFTGIMAWCDPVNNLIYLFMSNRTFPDEFNNKLIEEGIRTKIQEVIYQAIL